MSLQCSEKEGKSFMMRSEKQNGPYQQGFVTKGRVSRFIQKLTGIGQEDYSQQDAYREQLSNGLRWGDNQIRNSFHENFRAESNLMFQHPILLKGLCGPNCGFSEVRLKKNEVKLGAF